MFYTVLLSEAYLNYFCWSGALFAASVMLREKNKLAVDKIWTLREKDDESVLNVANQTFSKGI